MTTAVDTNVFSRIWMGDVEAERALVRCSEDGLLVICPIVYAEMLASPILDESEVKAFLDETGIRTDYAMREEVWTESGRRFAAYARRKRVSGGGDARRLVADFVVGSHALLQANRLLTYDLKIYRVGFPELRLVDVGTI
jgi:predicted nucleic acid-binding protein